MSSVTHLNTPRISDYEIDKEYNARKIALVADLDAFLVNHSRFKNKDVTVSFAQKGVSSLVCILETSEEKLVLKIPLSTYTGDSVGMFLKAWESVGVSVPHVFEEGKIGDHHYILMQYIDAPNLRDFYKLGGLIREKVFVKMGSILRRMHTTVAKGYGRVNNGIPECSDSKDWLPYPTGRAEEKISYVNERQLLDENKHGSIKEAEQVLRQLVQSDSRSTYCHDDFAVENIFATEPMTVFDPNPMFNHPYIDLARAIVIGISRCGDEAAEHLIEGYFSGEPYDTVSLRAGVLYQTYIKFAYWHKTGQEERIKRLQDYLSKN